MNNVKQVMSLDTAYPTKTINTPSEQSAPQVQEATQPQSPSQEYRVPTQMVDLPSKGLFYPKDHPLANGQIEIKAMTAKEEDILTTESFINNGTVLDRLFQSLIVTPFDYNTILSGDKTAIMIASRISAFGSEYTFTVQSPTTGATLKQNIDLSILEPREFSIPDDLVHTNKLQFTLPVSKAVLEVKILDHRDEQQIEREIARRKKHNQRDPSMSIRLKQHILSVDGNVRTNYINDFVENQLMVADSKALRAFIRKSTPDIDLSLEVYDEDSNEPFRTTLPLNSSFFWPDSEG